MEKYSIQGRAESMRWKREATLKDLLDLLDEIKDCDKTPEEKAKLTQRVIDYGQHLSEEIYLGKRPIPEDETMSIEERNEIRNKFNIRMYSTYYTKGESSYEEAQRPTGYFDEERRFIEDPYTGENPGTRNHKNPRWHPIPFAEEITPPPPPPPPTNDGNGGNDGGDPLPPPVNGGNGGNTGGGGNGGTGGVVPPIVPGNGGTAADGTEQEGNTARKEKDDNDKKRKAGAFIPFLIPLAITLAMINKDGKTEQMTGPEPEPIVPEAVVTPLTPEEQDYLKYTVEKGQRMTAKQFGVSIEEGAEIYNQFVENIKQGNMPDIMETLSEKYQMSKMVHPELNLNLNRPEIAATTWLLMSESYPAIANAVHQGMTKPDEEINQTNSAKMNTYLKLANAAAEKHNVNSESNLVSDVDYGLFGATKKTGWAISFREAANGKPDKADKALYNGIARDALDNGNNY